MIALPGGAGRSRSSFERIEVRHLPFQELIKQWHRKGGIAVRWAINHTFPNQTASDGRHRINSLAEDFGDATGPMRPRTQLRHCTHVPPFARRQAIHSHPEKASIQLGNRSIRRAIFDVSGCNRRAVRTVPCMLAPLLQKVGVASGFPEDTFKRGRLVRSILLYGFCLGSIEIHQS